MNLIYTIRCLPNGACYVGQTTQARKRRNNHFEQLRRGEHANAPMQKAFAKYGEEAFRFEVLEENVPLAVLTKREAYWIERLGSRKRDGGFNLREPGCFLRSRMKVTAKQVPQVVARIAAGEHVNQVADSLGVNPHTVRRIVSRETWAHVPVDPDILAEAQRVRAGAKRRAGLRSRLATPEVEAEALRRLAARMETGETRPVIAASLGILETTLHSIYLRGRT